MKGDPKDHEAALGRHRWPGTPCGTCVYTQEQMAKMSELGLKFRSTPAIRIFVWPLRIGEAPFQIGDLLPRIFPCPVVWMDRIEIVVIGPDGNGIRLPASILRGID